MRRRLLGAGAVLIALGLIAFLLINANRGDGADDAVGQDPERGYDADEAMTADSDSTTEGEKVQVDPSLRGTQDPDANAPQPVELQVVGQGGTPISEAMVALRASAGVAARAKMTDKAGKVTFPEAVLGTSTVSIAAKHGNRLILLAGNVMLTKPSQLIWIKRLRRVERVFRDADTGRPIAVPHVRVWDALADQMIEIKGPVTRVKTWHRSSAKEMSTFVEQVTPPEGYLHWDTYRPSYTISDYADELELDIPFRREVDVRLTVTNHKGEPTTEGHVKSVRIARRWLDKLTVTRDGFGTLHIKGVPFFRREEVMVRYVVPGTLTDETLRAFLGSDPTAPLSLTLQLPEPIEYEDDESGWEGPDFNSTIGLGGGSGSGVFRGRSPHKRGRVEIKVTRWNGNPAVGAQVVVGTRGAVTDKNGVAHIEEIDPGTYTVIVKQAGMLPVKGSVEVTPGGTGRVSLEEPAGGVIKLEVVDDLGVALPFARYELYIKKRLQAHVGESRGVQRVDPYTDHRGQETIFHVDPRIDTVRVYWGSRWERVPVKVTPGRSVPLRVVLKAPEGAPHR